MVRMDTLLATRRRPPGYPLRRGCRSPVFAKVRFAPKAAYRPSLPVRPPPPGNGKATPPHRPWGGVGVWGSPAQGEVRMVPYHPTATKVLLP